jgi:hypothetical protein
LPGGSRFLYTRSYWRGRLKWFRSCVVAALGKGVECIPCIRVHFLPAFIMQFVASHSHRNMRLPEFHNSYWINGNVIGILPRNNQLQGVIVRPVDPVDEWAKSFHGLSHVIVALPDLAS